MRLGLLLVAGLFACGDLSRTEPNPAAKEKIARARVSYDMSPNDPTKVVELADAYADANRLIEAIDGYQKAIEIGVKDPHVYGSLAALYVKFGYLQSAVDNIKLCMAVDRNHPECMFAIGSLFETDGSRQMLSQARRAFSAMLEVAPNHPRAALVKSKVDQLNAKLGPEEELPPAEQGAEQPAPGTAPKDAPPDPHAAIPGGADKDSEIGELNPFGAALQKAFDAMKNNDAPGAEKAFREALAIEPNDSTALGGLAQTLVVLKKTTEAIMTAERAVKADPKDPQAKHTLGLVLLHGARSAEDVKRGIATWEELVRDDPEFSKQVGLQGRLDEIRRMMKQQNVHE